MSKRSLREAVVVITGASSGIGRATALAFAKRGARVVVAARRQELLDSLVAECERMSGRSALAVPTDVSDETQVQALAERAVRRFGRIDVWINNAGVYAAGRFDDTPPQVFRRVVEVNFFGYVYGARAALPHLKRQHGVLINNASVDSAATFPYFSAYVASKWAVRGFSASLRQELVSDDVDVCTILPASIDTPLFQHAANYMGRAMKALNPTYDAEQVAAAMVRCAENGRPREVIVGLAGRLLALQYTLAPGLSERIFRKQVELDHFSPSTPAVSTHGNVLAPMAEGVGTSGGWKDSRGHRLPGRVIAGVAATALPLAGLLVRRWRTARQHKAAPGVLAPMVGRIRSFG
jgi:NAD(P)-dependent dehydrogenase (short-subunit alcohol dehydrogenase family)